MADLRPDEVRQRVLCCCGGEIEIVVPADAAKFTADILKRVAAGIQEWVDMHRPCLDAYQKAWHRW